MAVISFSHSSSKKRCDAGDGAGEEVDGAVESGTGVPARGGE